MISWTIIKIGKKTVTETAFYLARKKFNPQAICVMSNEFIANYYDNEADSLKNGKEILYWLSMDQKSFFPTQRKIQLHSEESLHLQIQQKINQNL
ncbi:hypothetical protein K080096A4_06970 [[Clostridium] innocuum]